MSGRRRSARTGSSWRRAEQQGGRIGADVKVARGALGWSRSKASRRAGVAPSTFARVEEGDGAVQLDTLCAVAGSVGLDVVTRAHPGRQPSLRDRGQLVTAEGLRRIANPIWRMALEHPAGDHGRAADAVFFGPDEVQHWELIGLAIDLQGQFRPAQVKREYLAARHNRPVRLVLAIEDTPRNRRVVEEHRSLIESVLTAGSREVLASLRSGTPLGQDGLVWVRRRDLAGVEPPAPRRPE